MYLMHEQQIFVCNLFTTYALHFFNENITSIDNGKYCSLVVFKDLCKVFDSVDPSVLLVKLEYYGILSVENDCMVCILSKQI